MIQIKEVTDNKALNIFIEFPNTLYKDCPQYVPELKQDVKNMLNPAKKLTTEHLFKTIWEDEEDVDESIVWVYISYLRQKLQAIQADISILGEKGGDFCLLAN